MSFRFRPTLLSLETRENPSGPELIYPLIGYEGMTGTEPATTTTTDPTTQQAIDTVIDGVIGGTTVLSIDFGDNSITKEPLDAGLLIQP